jgi:8-oxo-dGTP pyrophosphatase MutT (NUDIX family)
MNRADHLRLLLTDHAPSTPLEADHKARMLALLDAAGAFSRDHWSPGHFTASSFVLSPDRTAVLLILHSKLNRWLQPGGHVDPDDVDIVAAARREVAEEVGLSDLTPIGPALLDLDIHTIPARKSDPEHAHFDVRFLFGVGDLEFQAGSDALAGKWVPLSEIHTVESDESVMRAVRRIQA